MAIKHLPWRRFLSGILLLAALTGCESKQELETRMDEISGNYRLTAIYSGTLNQINTLPVEGRDAITSARIFASGKDWIFEYTLPIMVGSSFISHRIRQHIVWDRQLGAYYFYRLEENDLAGTGIDPSLVRMTLQGNTITFKTVTGNYGWAWTKIR